MGLRCSAKITLKYRALLPLLFLTVLQDIYRTREEEKKVFFLFLPISRISLIKG